MIEITYRRPYYKYPHKEPVYRKYPVNPDSSAEEVFGETVLYDPSVGNEILNALKESEIDDLSEFVNSLLRFAVSAAYPEIKRASDYQKYRNYLMAQAKDPSHFTTGMSPSTKEQISDVGSIQLSKDDEKKYNEAVEKLVQELDIDRDRAEGLLLAKYLELQG